MRGEPQRLARKARNAVERELYHLADGVLRLAAVAPVTVVQYWGLVVADPGHKAAHEPALFLQPLEVIDHPARHEPEVAGVEWDLDGAHSTDQTIKQAGGNLLEPGFPVALPPLRVDHVKPFAVLGIKGGDQLRRILKIRIHHDHRGTPADIDARGNRDLVAEIAAQVDGLHAPIEVGQAKNGVPGTVPAAVVHEDNLVRHPGPVQHRFDAAIQFRNAFFFVENREYDADLGYGSRRPTTHARHPDTPVGPSKIHS